MRDHSKTSYDWSLGWHRNISCCKIL